VIWVRALLPDPTCLRHHQLQHSDSCADLHKPFPPCSKSKASAGRWLAKWLAKLGWGWQRTAATRMPEARGDIREIVGQPVFVPLFKLFVAYGGVFRLSFGPKTFVIVSDPVVAKQILVTNAAQYSKGILSEILDFVMGKVSSGVPCCSFETRGGRGRGGGVMGSIKLILHGWRNCVQASRASSQRSWALFPGLGFPGKAITLIRSLYSRWGEDGWGVPSSKIC